MRHTSVVTFRHHILNTSLATEEPTPVFRNSVSSPAINDSPHFLEKIFGDWINLPRKHSGGQQCLIVGHVMGRSV